MHIIKDESFTKEIYAIREKLDEIKVSGYFKGAEDADIYYEYYKNDTDESKHKAIVISHGYSEDLIKYTEMIHLFYKKGYSVYAMEHRGMSRSARLAKNPERIHVEDYRYYISDLKKLVEDIVKVNEPGHDLYMYAHSQGGLIATIYVAKYPKDFKRTVLSSPYYYMSYKLPKWLVKAFCKLAIALHQEEVIVFYNSKNKKYPPFEKMFTSSKPRYEFARDVFMSHKELKMIGGTVGWLNECLKAQDLVFKKKTLARLKGRYLLITCGRDTMVKTKLHYKMKKKVPKMEFLELPEAKHEAYTERYDVQKIFYERVFKFLDDK